MRLVWAICQLLVLTACPDVLPKPQPKVPEPQLFCPIVSDARRNHLVVNDANHGGVVWTKSRPTGYGSVPAYRHPALGHGARIVESCALGGNPMLNFGGQAKGHRILLDNGQWASADQAGHAASDNLLSYAKGDPINFADVNGMCREPAVSEHMLDILDSLPNIGEQVRREEAFIAAASGLVDMIPVIGGLKMWAEMNTDHDLFTGERIHANEYGQAAGIFLNFLPLVGAGVSLGAEANMMSSGASIPFRTAAVEAETMTASSGGAGTTMNLNVAAEGTGATTWQGYERAVQNMYGGPASFSSRQYQAVVNGSLVNGVADNVTTIGGNSVAVEAKFVNNWATEMDP